MILTDVLRWIVLADTSSSSESFRQFGKYAAELGSNAYALFNALTDFASRPPALRDFRRSPHSMQVQAGRWLREFDDLLQEDPKPDLTEHLRDYRVTTAAASTGIEINLNPEMAPAKDAKGTEIKSIAQVVRFTERVNSIIPWPRRHGRRGGWRRSGIRGRHRRGARCHA